MMKFIYQEKKIETDALKTVGLFDIKVRLHPTVTANLKVEIIAE